MYDTEKIAKHEANSACIYLVCTFDPSRNRLWHYVGTDCIEKMIIELNTIAEQCIEEVKENKRMKYTKEDNIKFCKSKTCHICDKEITSKSEKVRDHDHRTGDFRGAARQM